MAVNFNTKYKAHSWYDHIDAYEKVPYGEIWNQCPNCGLVPHVWIFDNGRNTACGCFRTTYDHFSIHAESIMSHVKRHALQDYNRDELRKNWNHWTETGEILFKHASERDDGRW